MSRSSRRYVSPQPCKEDRSEVYPSVLLYGCGCWVAILTVGLVVWAAFGVHGW